MEELSRVTSGERWERSWAVETRLDLERGESVAVVGHKAIQWGEKKEGSVLDHQFEQLKAMSPKERGRYVEFLGSIGELPEGLQDISDRLIALEKGEIERKSGHMWECVGRRNGIYQFHMKPEYESDEAYIRKAQEIAPAVETNGKYAREMFDTSEVDEPLREAYQKSGLALLSEVGFRHKTAVMSLVYEELGYGAAADDSGTLMWLPNTKELEGRWAKLQEKNPKLADLRVLAAAGIATDEAFVLGHVTHNVLLSEDKEFIHDHTVHIVAQIELLASLAGKGIKFEQYKHSIAQGVFSLYKKILSMEHNLEGLDLSFRLSAKELAMIKRSMGAIIDLFSSQTRVADPSMFRGRARKVLQSRRSDFYRTASRDFGVKNIQRLPLLWTKLELAVGPLYGYPKLDRTEVISLLQDDPELFGARSEKTLFVRRGSGLPKELRYELVNGTRLVVNTGEHRFEQELESEGRVSQAELKELALLIGKNEEKVAKLVSSFPKRLREGAVATNQVPLRPDNAKVGDFVLWRWKSVYGNGFALSVVKENKGREFFQNYVVRPGLKKNVIGFHVGRYNAEEGEFIPASNYEQLLLQLEKGELGGEKLRQEIQLNHLDS